MTTQQGRSGPSRKVRYEEAARHIGVLLSTLYALVHQKRIPHYRYGRRFVMFDLDELDEWMRQHRVAAPSTPISSMDDPSPDTDTQAGGR